VHDGDGRQFWVECDGASVVLGGEIDMAAAAEVSAVLGQALARLNRVEVDLSAVTFLDSTGLRALCEAADGRAPSSESRLVCRDPSPQVQRVLDITGMSSTLIIEQCSEAT
jgi:anti-sigma B factor antagonist